MDTKKLRQKILDLAIRGKLVPQDPNDEPASVLLERIRAEKEQLIKEGKIKRSKKSAASDISHYENVPNNWAITSFEEIVELISGRDLETSSCNDIKEGIPYLIGASNIVKRSLFITRWTTKPIVISQKNDILISCKGTIGEVIRNTIGDIHIARQFMALRNNSIVDTNYIELYIRAILERIKSDARGVIPGISREDILCREILLPPLNEQKRIVLEASKLISIIEKINVDKNELVKAIAAYKLTILQLAITGKLVPQDLSDEPAIDLLRRVNPNYKPCDNRHYANVPETWEVVALKDVTEIITGSTPSKSVPAYYSGDVPFYKPNDLDQGRHVRTASEHLSQQGKEISRSIPSNSIAVCCIGSIGKCGYIEHEGVTNQQINTIIPNEAIFPLYLFYFCNSTSFIDKLKSESSAVTIPIVNKSKLSTIQIPLPPISEQKRIVNAIETILHKLDIIVGEIL